MSQQALKKKSQKKAPENLANYFGIVGVRLCESHCLLSLDGGEFPKQIKINITVAYNVQKETKGVIIRCACEVSTLKEGDKPPAISIRAAYECLYQAKSAKAFSSVADAVPALSASAQFHAWPYLRRHIHQTTLDMGVPPIVLPMFVPGAGGQAIGKVGNAESKANAKTK